MRDPVSFVTALGGPADMVIADLEIGLHRRDAYCYGVDLRYVREESDEWATGEASFDIERLRKHSSDDRSYGEMLAESLLRDPKVGSLFLSALRAGDDHPLRLRFFITAPELQTIRWERLWLQGSDAPLAAQPNIYFSRYLSSTEWGPVQLRPEAKLRVLIAIANPRRLDTYNLPSVDVDAEIAEAAGSLAGHQVEYLRLPGESSLQGIVERLQTGFDVFFLVCHGAFDSVNNRVALLLESPSGDGEVDPVDGSLFVGKLETLAHRPRLVVLMSCESAGAATDQGAVSEAQLGALGPRLSGIGIPAVLAIHGRIAQPAAEGFIACFLRELLQDGHVDRALTAARSALWPRDDWWRPVLFTRLRSGSIWYRPGPLKREVGDFWTSLCEHVRVKKCTPILGPGLTEHLFGTRQDYSRRWADDNRYALAPSDRESVPQVAQYLGSLNGRLYAVNKLGDFLRGQLIERFEGVMLESLRRERKDSALSAKEIRSLSIDEMLGLVGRTAIAEDALDPHRVLASLQLPLYVTAGHSDLMYDALDHEASNAKGSKPPRRGLYHWSARIGEWPEDDLERLMRMRRGRRPEPSLGDLEGHPLVYHLFGHLRWPLTVALSEDDYFDYLYYLDQRESVGLPNLVGSALNNSALLILGFSLDDWTFRVFLRSLRLRSQLSRENFPAIAVQVDPDETRVLKPNEARKYLQRYLQTNRIELYFGSVVDFVKQFRDELVASKVVSA